MTRHYDNELNLGRQNHPQVQTGNRHDAYNLESSTITTLYIDNDSEMQSIVSYLCELKCPIRMYTVSSGNEALQFLNLQPVSVIVSEYEFPGYNGLEFLKTLRKYGINIPIIFFSALNVPSVKEKAKKNGAFAYISRGGAEMQPFGHLIRMIFEAVHSSNRRTPVINKRR